MNLINGLKELKAYVFENAQEQKAADFLMDLSKKYDISTEDLASYYNYMALWKVNYPRYTKTGTVAWTKGEYFILDKVIKHYTGRISLSKVFQLLSPIFNRTTEGISFFYYNALKKGKIPQDKQQNAEVVNKEFQVVDEQVQQEAFELDHTNKNVEQPNSQDVLDSMEIILENVEKVEGVEIGYLFQSLATLTDKAVQNQSVSKIEALTKQLADTEDLLEEKEEEIMELNKQVETFETTFSSLNKEYQELKKNIQHFNSLKSHQKISELRRFNEELNRFIQQYEQKVDKRELVR